MDQAVTSTLRLERPPTAPLEAGSGPASLRALLKTGTAVAHEALEATALMRAFAAGTPSVSAYADYLSRQLRLHQPLEAALLGWLPAELAQLRLRKTGWLCSDLLAMDYRLPTTPPPPKPVIGSWAEALGTMYVLEGGTLGLQVVRKRLPDGHPAHGGSGRFMHGYGEQTGLHWRGFIELLEALPAPQWPAALGAARTVFERFHAVFSESPVPPVANHPMP